MQKPILPLLILCIVALPFLGKAQSMNSLVEPNAKLKKGDWFNIEFANRLEDYSTPVDSVNYCDPENLLQLVLHCEVTDVSKKKLNVKITLERLFHITDSGEYYDSYFTIYDDDYYLYVWDTNENPEKHNFELNTKIDLKNEIFELTQKETESEFNDMYYYYRVRRADIVTTRYSSRSDITILTGSININDRLILIRISEIKELVSTYLKDWSANEYKLPLPTFGNLQVTNFRKYRIIDANIPVQQNTELVIETGETTANDLVEVIFKDDFEDFTTPTIKHTLNGYLEDGKIVFKYYLEKQRELTLRYRGEEMNFVATPGKELNLKLQLNNDLLDAEFIGDNPGDNACEKEFALSNFAFTTIGDWVDYTDSYEAFHDIMETNTQNLVRKLDQYKSQMTVNRYIKKLKMIYYWAASQSAEWHQAHRKTLSYLEHKERWFDYTKLNEMSYYKNIYPISDYYLEPDFYKEYLKIFAKIPIEGISENKLVSEIQGFQMEFFSHPYFLLDILFKGYPKFYYLANDIINIDGSLSRVSPGNITMKKYNHFMTTCNYPPFIKQVQKAYEIAVSTDYEKSILNLDLNFVKDKNYKKNSGNYKLIGFLKNKIDQQKISEIRDSIINIENRFDLKNNFEMYLVYTDDNMISDVVGILSSYKDIPVKPIKLSLDEFYSDMENLALLENGDYPKRQKIPIVVLTDKNKIIDLDDYGLNLLGLTFQLHERRIENLKSQKNYGQLIIIILSSLLFFGFLSWFVIRIRTRQIQNREIARRKVSELELTAIRSQMNPHFIFNAMGSIQNLINQNKVKNANLYLASFARLMRMVLANSNKKLVSMSHELELIETYLKLEQLRVDFTFTISVAENIDPEVEELPGMLIQPFIENAVIHGITPKGKGNIDVAFSKKDSTLICEITDDGVGIDTAKVANGNGLAMKLSEKRLDLLNSQLQDKLKLVVENRMVTEKTSGTKITLYIPVG